jgi:predicted ABC-type ATPase
MTDVESQEPLRAIVFAGPNGSGKSTITNAVVENPALFKGEYINADNIAKSLEKEIPNYTERNIQAANIAEERRLAAFREHRAVAFETVMSTPEKVALMTHAKAEGYEVTLVFVTTDDAEKNVQRVQNRVAQGGHAVEPDAIRDRYAKTMSLLGAALDHADQAKIYDNSSTTPMVVAVKQGAELDLHNPAQHPAWVQKSLVEPYLERVDSRERIAEVFEKSASKEAVLQDADASNGKTYSGPILAVTKHHVLQKTGDELYQVHDRSLSAAKDLEPGKDGTIEYAFHKGKIVTPEIRAAMSFERDTPEVALAKHPELAGAYAAVAAIEKQAQADGLTEQQRAVVLAAATRNVVKGIERGEIPEIKIKEEIEIKQEKSIDR